MGCGGWGLMAVTMKLVTTKFKSGGLHEKHVVATWNVGEPSQHLLLGTGKPRNIGVSVHRSASIFLCVPKMFSVLPLDISVIILQDTRHHN